MHRAPLRRPVAFLWVLEFTRMAEQRELNYHFKQLTAGAPAEVLSQLGEALLAVNRLRAKDKVDAAGLLRQAWFSLARHLVRAVGAELNPQQQLFLQSGALADSVVLRDPSGERVTVELLPGAYYEQLVGLYSEPVKGLPSYLLTPIRRMGALGRGQFGPFDLNKPGRYREPSGASQQRVDRAQLKSDLHRIQSELESARMSLANDLKQFIALLGNESLEPAIKAVSGLLQEAQQFLSSSLQLESLGGLEVVGHVTHPSIQVVDSLVNSLNTGGQRVRTGLREVLRQMVKLEAQCRVLSDLGNADTSADHIMPEPVVVLDDAAKRVVENDLSAMNSVIVQTLDNVSGRTPWTPGRVLVAELFERFDDPVNECCATPWNLAASLKKAQQLHPDCFPVDAAGQALLPPVYIVPGVDIVKWFDDRFVVSFVHTGPARAGSKLKLTPVDLAALRICGQFTARGDLYDYRGNRVSGNFIADYSGEVKSKAAVKFIGESKKMTLTTSTEVADSAGRDEAVEDYVDFFHHTWNGLPLPKRITPRRVGVILEYCTIGDAERTAALAMKHVIAHDSQQVRRIIHRLAGNNAGRIVQAIRQVLEGDPQTASRFRGQLDVAVKEVMGQEFYLDARNAGLLEAKAGQHAAAPTEPEEGGETAAQAGHDYFDV